MNSLHLNLPRDALNWQHFRSHNVRITHAVLTMPTVHSTRGQTSCIVSDNPPHLCCSQLPLQACQLVGQRASHGWQRLVVHLRKRGWEERVQSVTHDMMQALNDSCRLLTSLTAHATVCTCCNAHVYCVEYMHTRTDYGSRMEQTRALCNVSKMHPHDVRAGAVEDAHGKRNTGGKQWGRLI